MQIDKETAAQQTTIELVTLSALKNQVLQLLLAPVKTS